MTIMYGYSMTGVRTMGNICSAVLSGKVRHKGKSSLEFFYNGKPHYYCYGYIDKMDDELIPECKNCKLNVSFAQEDFDLINRRSK